MEQRVSVSSLSQRLRDMEERLGVRLMNRTTRSVALTEAGELLLARVGPAMSDVGAALDQVRGLRGVPSGRLRINAPPPAIDLVLAPMVAPFLAALSARSIWRSSARARSSISSAGGFDAGVRYGEHLAQDMIAVSLGPPQRYAVVASPRICRAAWQAEASEGPARSRLHPHPLRQRRDAGLGVREGRPRREGVAAGETDRDLSGPGAARRA